MAGTISSVGIGSSGLDVSSIITKLVELERAPLTKLEAQSTLITTRVSAYSQIKSLSSTLSDSALKLSLSTTWKAVSATSGDTSAVQVATTSTSTPAIGSISVQVQQLAKAQSAASESFTTGSSVGAGTLHLQLGTWNTGAFTAGSSAAVDIAVADGETVSDIATKINAANAGVTATVLTDASGQRLMLRSSTTGEAAGFRMSVTETTPDAPEAGLSRLAFDPEDGAYGMAQAANAVAIQYGQNAKATINNIAVTSTTNTFTDTMPGLAITVSKETTSAVPITVAADNTAMTKSVQTFVDAYNALSSFISANTAYDAEKDQATLMQGDSIAIGIQNMLRSLVGSVTTGGKLERLSDIGVSLQRDGSLALDTTKLTGKLTDLDSVSNLFTAANDDPQSAGFGVKLKTFMSGLLSSAGTIANRTSALEAENARNAKEQDKVNDRADRVQTRLQKHYTALDTKMASLTALNTYITQQVAQWNKSTG